MPDRFYCPQISEQMSAGSEVAISGTEAHHLAQVLRKKPGEIIEVFDGAGRFATAEIVSCSKSKVIVQAGELQQSAESARRLTIAAAVPKGDRFRWMIEKLTELGASRFIPLQAERSVVHPGSGKMTKMEQAVIAACKQSGRNDLLRIDETATLPQLLEQTGSGDCLTLMAHVPEQSLPAQPAPEQSPTDAAGHVGLSTAVAECGEKRDVIVMIGPEGGFSPAEVELAVGRGMTIVGLGENILRMETAAVAVAAWFALDRS